jgi:two-component system, NarL family, sensor histidine kinase BarA
MSYRTFKKLLGETSLERKCRFLFGGGLMLLITGSFYFYARLNSTLVYKQNQTTGRLLIAPILMKTHWEHFFTNDEDVKPLSKELTTAVNPEDLRGIHWHFMYADPSEAFGERRPADAAGYEALARIKRGDVSEVIDIDHAEGEYNYYFEIRADQSCIRCHQEKSPGLKKTI